MLTKPSTRGGAALARAIQELYQREQTDYDLEPIVLSDRLGQPIGRIRDGDAVIFCCRRGEREIQLTEAFTEPGFERFPRPDFHGLTFVPLTLYHEKFKHLPVAFAPTKQTGTLGETASCAGLRQLRVAESEKYAHVTFFLNGGKTAPSLARTTSVSPLSAACPSIRFPSSAWHRSAHRFGEGSIGAMT